MLLHKIRLVDFRQFYGDNQIEFSTDPDKNVTLVHGENGVGKTTLLNAILWCCFGKLTHDFENQNELISLEAIKEKKHACRVELELEHEGSVLHILRRYDSKDKSQNAFKIHKIEKDGNFKDVPSPKNYINSILPEDMSGYFFFHGEGIAEISGSKSGEKFRRAIRDILGFTFAEQASIDLAEQKKKQAKKCAEHSSVNKKIKDAIERRDAALISQKKKRERIKSYDEKISNLLSEAKKFDELLSNSGHQVAEQKKKRLDNAINSMKTLESKERNLADAKRKLIQDYGWAIFGNSLAKEGLSFIDESALKGRIPAPYDAVLVNDLISDEKCICGRPLKDGTKEFDKVKEMLETANTGLITQRVSKARAVADKITNQASEFLEAINELENQNAQLSAQIRQVEIDIENLSKELRGFNEGNISEWQKGSEDCHAEARAEERKKGADQAEVSRLESVIKALDKEIHSEDSTNAVITRLKNYDTFLNDLIDKCESKLEIYEKSARASIKSDVDKILEQFSRKSFKTRLGEDFSFDLIRSDGKKAGKSKGENLLLNLAFVSALIQLAGKRAGASGDFLVSGTVAPFVIDAPFGELDKKYREATASFIPEHSEQVIFFLSSSHWAGEVDKAIRPRIGKEYLLVMNSREEQGSKPIDEIEINGKKYAQSEYGMPKDKTYVKEVN